MANVLLYTTRFCPYCIAAKRLLGSKDVTYREINVGRDPKLRAEMSQKSGGRYTVPQIFIGDTHVGGSDELHALEREGGLDKLLEAS